MQRELVGIVGGVPKPLLKANNLPHASAEDME